MPGFGSKVEVEFTPGVWTDVSEWVEGFDAGRGRSYEFDEIEAGTGTLMLANPDGRFTPGKVAGAFYPNVKPRRRCRISTETGVAGGVFSGWVERWPVTIDQGNSSVAAVLTDDLAAAGRRKFLKPYFHEMVTSYSPTYYWPLNEPADAIRALSVTPRRHELKIVPSVEPTESGGFGGTGLLSSGEQDQGGSFVVDRGLVPDATAEGWQSTESVHLATAPGLQHAPLSSATSWAYFAVLDISTIAVEVHPNAGKPPRWSAQILGAVDTDPAIVPIRSTLVLESGVLSVYLNSFFLAGGMRFTLPTGTGVVPMLIVHDHINNPGFVKFQAGDTSVDIPLLAGVPSAPVSSINVGKALGAGLGSYSISNVAVWEPGSTLPIQLTDGTFIGEALAAISGEQSRSVNDVMSSLFRITGSPHEVDADDTEIAFPDPPVGTSILEVAQQCATSVDGLVFATPAGSGPRLRYVSRQARFAPGPAVMTFRDSTGTSPDPGLTFDTDEGKILNSVTITRPGMSTMYASDQESIDEYGTIDGDFESLVVDDEVAQGMADWRIYLRKQPQVRCDVAEFSLTASGIDPNAFSALDIGSRVDLAELPITAPAASGRYFVEGLSYKCEVDGEVENWTATLQLSPSDMWGVWTIGDPVYGFIDDDNAVLSY